jgi:hypothetical protein
MIPATRAVVVNETYKDNNHLYNHIIATELEEFCSDEQPSPEPSRDSASLTSTPWRPFPMAPVSDRSSRQLTSDQALQPIPPQEECP